MNVFEKLFTIRKVDDYIANLPEDKQELCSNLRELVLSLVPHIEERLSFRIPFYHYFGMLLYITFTKHGFAVTFCRGKDLVMAFPQLIQANRAIAAHVIIANHADIANTGLREIIVAAADWNQEAFRLKIPMVKKKKK